MEAAEEDRRGQKRAADESPAHTLQPSGLLQQLQSYKGQRVDVEPASIGNRGREGQGLVPPTPSERRRRGAEDALESRRETHKPKG